MESTKNTRTIVLLLIAVVALSLVVGFLVLRNTLVDRLSFTYFARGTELSKQDADGLEQNLKSDEGSFADRIELLAFYSFKVNKDGLTQEDVVNRREHVLWVIQHEPSSHFAGDYTATFGSDGGDPDGLQQGKNLWLQQVQTKPTNVRVLYNAGRFFSWADDWQQSEELLERAYKMEPKNHDVASFLAGIYWRDARKSLTAEQVTTLAKRSLGVYEQALRDTDGPREKLYDLPEAAQAAFEAGDYERAASYSNEALSIAARPDYNNSNADAIHYGNIVLGRIALRQGDMDHASSYLLKAAAIKDSPHLETFGPNMMLAKELLERGDRKSVLEYFDLCGKFWKDDDGKLVQWRAVVASGHDPDFGANLRY